MGSMIEGKGVCAEEGMAPALVLRFELLGRW